MIEQADILHNIADTFCNSLARYRTSASHSKPTDSGHPYSVVLLHQRRSSCSLMFLNSGIELWGEEYAVHPVARFDLLDANLQVKVNKAVRNYFRK